MAAPTSNAILKVRARAFTNPFLSSSSLPPSLCSEGGNPVTVFHFPGNDQGKRRREIPSSTLRSELAKSCPWESVVSYSSYDYYQSDNVDSHVAGNKEKKMSNTHRIWFYMPNGQEVSYCAHAAMAACSVLKQYEGAIKDGGVRRHTMINKSSIRFVTGIISDGDEKEGNKPLLENIATVQQQKQNQLNEVTLQMSSSLHEERVNRDTVLKLLEQVGLSYNDVIISNSNLPSFINSSVSRSKTLVPIKESMLNIASNPKDAIVFRDLCDQIQSTGLYLYTPSFPSQSSPSSLPSSSAYECRQFPRFSGYPEDPATGIAAAALAYSLFSRRMIRRNDELEIDSSSNDNKNTGTVTPGIHSKKETSICYELFQGVAMGKPSRIKIRIDKNGYDHILSCSGIVEIDSIEEVTM